MSETSEPVWVERLLDRPGLWLAFLWGLAEGTLLGSGLYWLTPFSPLESLGMSLAITLMGFSAG